MLKHLETQNVDELLSEADELLRQIHSDVFDDMADAHRLEFEKHAQNLKQIKARALEKSAKEGAPEPNSGASGVHEAILDIVKAMHGLKMKGKAKETAGKQAVIH
jgi:hypothetical protein